MLATSPVTVTATLLLVTPDADAAISVVPSATAVTVPLLATVATPVAFEAHVNVTPLTVAPPASFATAPSECVAPTDVSVTGPAGVTSIVETVCATVTTTVLLVTSDAEAVLLAGPSAAALAVMFAVPLATAVTVPSAATVTTSVSSETQVNVTPLIAAPPESCATALSD